MASDPFNLQRFVEAQGGGVHDRALAELHAGAKRSHWMWFIFPQSVELGRSAIAKYYGLSGEEEARAYLAHPILGPGYRECVTAVRAQVDAGKSLEASFGELKRPICSNEPITNRRDGIVFSVHKNWKFLSNV